MRDYIKYIDFNAIKLADLANTLGEFKIAFENYSKALNKLSNYQGDRMLPIEMASEITKKRNEIIGKNMIERFILKNEVWKLTKTSFVKGNQCKKYLYLDKYKKHEKSPISEIKKELFNQGHAFEDKVRLNDFPNGVNIKDTVGDFAYFNSYTSHLLNSPTKQIIYEATIIEEEVLIMCDILLKHENGLIDIYEVKHNMEINDAIISDLSLQYTICKKRFNTKLNSFNLILRAEENWEIIDLTFDLDKNTSIVNSKISDYKQILIEGEPLISMGEHCKKPYECEFVAYCKRSGNYHQA